MADDPTQRLDIVPNVTTLAAERGETSSAPPISVTNVIPFVRPQREAVAGLASDIALKPGERPAPHQIDRQQRARIVALFALSLAVHYGLYLLFNREPEPMASIGLEAISVEIMLGANMQAGLAATPGQQQVQSAPADDPKPNPIDPDSSAKVEEIRPTEIAPDPQQAAKPADSAAEVRPERAAEVQEQPPVGAEAMEAAPERPEKPREQVALLPSEPTAAAREPELTLVSEEPARVALVDTEKPKPAKIETKPGPAPKREAKTKARAAQPEQERPGPAQNTASREPNPTGPRSSAASGVGPGRSQLATNYRGLVAAHLARHKRFPSEARSRGEQGGATVSFALDGGGRVTRVSLVRATGSAILDHEVTAMVRRASPFPAPPDGRPKDFTVPVSFRIQ